MPTILPLLLIAALSLPASIQQQDLGPNPDAEGVYHFAKDVTIPKLVYSVEPDFSEKARKQKVFCSVKVQFIVGTDGSVHNITVVHSATEAYPDKKDRKYREAAATLDLKAIEAVQQYRFEPAQFQRKPVPFRMTVEVSYQIF